ncbi:membrane or secreted protein [Fulvivirgaceae bacterium LMO-SS25]
MKRLLNYSKILSLFFASALLFSCGETSTESTTEVEETTEEVADAPNIQGAWKLQSTNGVAEENEVVAIVSPSFTAFSVGAAETGAFIAAGGGFYNFDNGKLNVEVAFDTEDSTMVGTTIAYDYSLDGNTFTTMHDGNTYVYSKIDDSVTDLTGNWRMLGRPNADGVLEERRPVGDRVTIKILSGTRFQWAAINTGTKQFLGTGAGTYTIEDSTYTEHITVFSRNNDRVGAVLPFNYRIQDGDWYHSGNNSSGEPMAEVWARYER